MPYRSFMQVVGMDRRIHGGSESHVNGAQRMQASEWAHQYPIAPEIGFQGQGYHSGPRVSSQFHSQCIEFPGMEGPGSGTLREQYNGHTIIETPFSLPENRNQIVPRVASGDHDRLAGTHDGAENRSVYQRLLHHEGDRAEEMDDAGKGDGFKGTHMIGNENHRIRFFDQMLQTRNPKPASTAFETSYDLK